MQAKKKQIDGGMGHLGLLSYPVLMAADVLLYRLAVVRIIQQLCSAEGCVMMER